MPVAFSIQLNQNATPQLQLYLLNTSRLILRYQQPTELLFSSHAFRGSRRELAETTICLAPGTSHLH